MRAMGLCLLTFGHAERDEIVSCKSSEHPATLCNARHVDIPQLLGLLLCE